MAILGPRAPSTLARSTPQDPRYPWIIFPASNDWCFTCRCEAYCKVCGSCL